MHATAPIISIQNTKPIIATIIIYIYHTISLIYKIDFKKN